MFVPILLLYGTGTGIKLSKLQSINIGTSLYVGIYLLGNWYSILVLVIRNRAEQNYTVDTNFAKKKLGPGGMGLATLIKINSLPSNTRGI